jgi:hypothetical protein
MIPTNANRSHLSELCKHLADRAESARFMPILGVHAKFMPILTHMQETCQRRRICKKHAHARRPSTYLPMPADRQPTCPCPQIVNLPAHARRPSTYLPMPADRQPTCSSAAEGRPSTYLPMQVRNLCKLEIYAS